MPCEEGVEMGTAPPSKDPHEPSRQLVPRAARRWEMLHTHPNPPVGAGPGSGNLNLINCFMLVAQAVVHPPGTTQRGRLPEVCPCQACLLLYPGPPR